MTDTTTSELGEILGHFLITAKQTISGEPDPKALKSAKSQLLAEILKGAKKYEVEYTGEMRPTSLNTMSRIYTKTEQAIPTQYLKELFNEKEK